MLNEYQRRRVSITIRSLEKDLHVIEESLKSEGYSGIPIKIKNDIPSSVRNALILKVGLLKEKIGNIAENFALEMRTESISERIFSMLSFDWVSLEEIKAKRLRGYGEVSEGLHKSLDRKLDSLMGVVDEMLGLLTSKQK